jgi:hypothetical protein
MTAVAKDRDEDVKRAEQLAEMLTGVARGLALPPEQALATVWDGKGEPPPGWRKAEIELCRRSPAEYLEKVRDGQAALIRRLHAAWMGVDASNAGERDGQRRESLLGLCRQYGAMLKDSRRFAERAPQFEDWLVQGAIKIYAQDVPDHAALIAANSELVRAFVRACAREPGAPRRATAAEALCEAMGFPASYDSAKTAQRRRRRRAQNKTG